MNVIFNTYPYAFVCPGGGEMQLMKTLNALKKYNVNAELYDQWNPNLDKADVVNFFSVQGGTYNFCTNIKNSNIPLVISPILWPKGELSKYPLAEINSLLNMADFICPNSDIEGKIISEVFNININKFHTVYNGVDDHFLDNNDDLFPGLFKDHFSITRPFLLTVGNIEPRKNQLSLIKSLNISHLDYDLIMIGNIRDRFYFNECINESKNNNVKYLGHIDHKSPLLRSAYKACDLFVLPSFCETPGLAALEAGSMGSKIVITSEGSTYEYFKDFVSYIDPHSLESIQKGMINELNTERDNQLKNRIKNHYSWNHTAQQVINCYKKLIH